MDQWIQFRLQLYLQNDEKIQVNDQTTKKYLSVYIPASIR